MRLDLDELERWLEVASPLPWRAKRPRVRVQIKDARDYFVHDTYGFRHHEDALAIAPCMSALPALVRIARAAQTLAWFDPESGDRGAKSWDELYDALRTAGLLGEDEG